MDFSSTPDDGSTARVVVADDNAMLRAGFVALLERARGITVVGEAGNGAEAIHMALATHPDVVLMDVLMPVVDGVVATGQLFAAHDHLPAGGLIRPRVVMLTDNGGDEYVYEALREGARGFVSKDSRPDELEATVRTAASTETIPWPADVIRLVTQMTSGGGERPLVAQRRKTLATGDAIVIVGVGRGHNNSEIAGHLGVTEEEVRRRIAGLMTTLQLRDRTQLLVFAYESGLITPLAPAA